METKRLNLIMNLIKFGLVAVGVVACALIIGGPNMDATVEAQEEFRDGSSMAMAINYTIVIIFATLALVLFFFVVQLLTNTKKTIMSIIGIVAALVIYMIFLALGTTDTNESLLLAEDVQVSDGTIASTTAGIYTVIVAMIIGGLAWILSPLMGKYRK